MKNTIIWASIAAFIATSTWNCKATNWDLSLFTYSNRDNNTNAIYEHKQNFIIKNSQSIWSKERELLWIRIYDVDWEYNKHLADTLAEVWNAIKVIIPRNIYVKTSLDEIQIWMKWNVSKILWLNIPIFWER